MLLNMVVSRLGVNGVDITFPKIASIQTSCMDLKANCCKAHAAEVSSRQEARTAYPSHFGRRGMKNYHSAACSAAPSCSHLGKKLQADCSGSFVSHHRHNGTHSRPVGLGWLGQRLSLVVCSHMV